MNTTFVMQSPPLTECPEPSEPAISEFSTESALGSLPDLRPATRAVVRGTFIETLEKLYLPKPKTDESNEGVDADGSTEDDRRAHPRHRGICLVTVVPVEEDRAVKAEERFWMLHSGQLRGHMIDVSLSGLAFIGDSPIEAEASIFIRMSNYRLGTNLDTSGRVLRCSATEDDRYRIVCTFDYNLSEDQVTTLSKQIFDGQLV